tara:strand:- start:370 stop:675 length:306 start_codon:yes stop_codon:yes gene_type:complete
MVQTDQESQVADTGKLRKEAGRWLRLRREELGLSQRDLARLVKIDYYTFISQIEAGRGRVPADRIQEWASALEINPRDLAVALMKFYDPHTYKLIFHESDK